MSPLYILLGVDALMVYFDFSDLNSLEQMSAEFWSEKQLTLAIVGLILMFKGMLMQEKKSRKTMKTIKRFRVVMYETEQSLF